MRLGFPYEASMRPDRKLGEGHNQCSGCNAFFNSESAHVKHRAGEFGKDRRCLTPTEMLEAGMARNADGWWVSSPMQEGRFQPSLPPQDASVGFRSTSPSSEALPCVPGPA